MEDRLKLQRLTNIAEDRIHVWFQNRRAKEKRDAGRRLVALECKKTPISPSSGILTMSNERVKDLLNEESCDGTHGAPARLDDHPVCGREHTMWTLQDTTRGSPPKKIARSSGIVHNPLKACAPRDVTSNQSVDQSQTELPAEGESVTLISRGTSTAAVPVHAVAAMECGANESCKNNATVQT